MKFFSVGLLDQEIKVNLNDCKKIKIDQQKAKKGIQKYFINFVLLYY